MFLLVAAAFCLWLGVTLFTWFALDDQEADWFGAPDE